MGPSFCKDGNYPAAQAALASRAALQWGHPFARMEIREVGLCPGAISSASMGPSFCKDGNPFGQAGLLQGNGASMGPSFCKDGNLRLWLDSTRWSRGFNGAILLQGWKFTMLLLMGV
jgi:hypothetical protein